MLVYLEEWHLGDGLPAPAVGAVSNLGVVAENTLWLPAPATPPGPIGSTGSGVPPDVLGTVVWRPEDHPDQGGELTDLAGFGFVLQTADGLVLARSPRSSAADTSFDSQWSRSTPATPPVGSRVVLPAVELTIDPGYLWSQLRELDTAPDGWIDYRVDRIRPCRARDGGPRLILEDQPVAVNHPSGPVSGFLLDLTAEDPRGVRSGGGGRESNPPGRDTRPHRF